MDAVQTISERRAIVRMKRAQKTRRTGVRRNYWLMDVMHHERAFGGPKTYSDLLAIEFLPHVCYCHTYDE
jgi:hypothetical protein